MFAICPCTRCGKMAFRVRSALTGLLAWLSRTNKLHLTPLVRPMLQYGGSRHQSLKSAYRVDGSTAAQAAVEHLSRGVRRPNSTELSFRPPEHAPLQKMNNHHHEGHRRCCWHLFDRQTPADSWRSRAGGYDAEQPRRTVRRTSAAVWPLDRRSIGPETASTTVEEKQPCGKVVWWGR